MIYRFKLSVIQLYIMDAARIIYLVTISAVGLILYYVLHRIVEATTKDRLARIKNLSYKSPIDTLGPDSQALKKFQKAAIKGIQSRFNIFRRVFIVLIIVLFFGFLSTSYVNNLPQTLISVIVGAGAIIMGMAAKPFIENFLAGLALTSSKSINIGDAITVNDHYGTVEDISLTHTIVKMWDWRRYVIPNSEMITSDFINYTLDDSWVWVKVKFYVSYNTDLRKIEKIATDITYKYSQKYSEERPKFWVIDTDKDSLECWVAGWSDSPSNAWALKSEVLKDLVPKLKELGIVPQTTYHNVNKK